MLDRDVQQNRQTRIFDLVQRTCCLGLRGFHIVALNLGAIDVPLRVDTQIPQYARSVVQFTTIAGLQSRLHDLGWGEWTVVLAFIPNAVCGQTW